MPTLSLRRINGQGMTEYLIIVALIAVAAIGVYGLFGSAVRNQVAAMAAELGGEDGSKAVSRASASGKQADSISSKLNKASLKNYTEGASKVLDK